MWPFKKKGPPPGRPSGVPANPSFSQVDVTERFGDNLSLGPNDWIRTVPLNIGIKQPESMGLPPVGANDERTYQVADRLSRMRETVSVPSDGVYCPICHIANIQLGLLRTPCPKCGRPLLKFGWD